MGNSLTNLLILNHVNIKNDPIISSLFEKHQIPNNIKDEIFAVLSKLSLKSWGEVYSVVQYIQLLIVGVFNKHSAMQQGAIWELRRGGRITETECEDNINQIITLKKTWENVAKEISLACEKYIMTTLVIDDKLENKTLTLHSNPNISVSVKEILEIIHYSREESMAQHDFNIQREIQKLSKN